MVLQDLDKVLHGLIPIVPNDGKLKLTFSAVLKVSHLESSVWPPIVAVCPPDFLGCPLSCPVFSGSPRSLPPSSEGRFGWRTL